MTAARAPAASLRPRDSALLISFQREARRADRWTRLPMYVGFGLLAVIVLSAVLCPLIAPYKPTAIDLEHTLSAPSWSHLMGTDETGRDVFSRVLYGLRLDLIVIAVMTYASVAIGVTLGAIAGYAGRFLDGFIGRLIDVVMAFPFLVLVLGVVAITGPGVKGVIIGASLAGWAVYARLTRGEMLTVKERQYVAAARVLGYSSRRVLFRHALPNVVRPALVFSMSDLVLNLLVVATLSYLGLGVQPPRPEIGSIIADGQSYLLTAWWITTLPGLLLVLLGVSFSLIGDGLAERAGYDLVVRG